MDKIILTYDLRVKHEPNKYSVFYKTKTVPIGSIENRDCQIDQLIKTKEGLQESGHKLETTDFRDGIFHNRGVIDLKEDRK